MKWTFTEEERWQLYDALQVSKEAIHARYKRQFSAEQRAKLARIGALLDRLYAGDGDALPATETRCQERSATVAVCASCGGNIKRSAS